MYLVNYAALRRDLISDDINEKRALYLSDLKRQGILVMALKPDYAEGTSLLLSVDDYPEVERIVQSDPYIYHRVYSHITPISYVPLDESNDYFIPGLCDALPLQMYAESARKRKKAAASE